jgi:LemA protein
MNSGQLIISAVLIAIVLLTLLASYNALTQQRQEVRSAWSRMDQQLKNRYQFVPALLQVVQASGGPPSEKLGAVSAARNQAAVAVTPTQLADAESALSIAIQQVLTLGQQQEGLKSNPQFIELRRQLIASENRIALSIQRYNDQVQTLNASMSSFPYMLTAKAIGLRLQPLFGAAIPPDATV